MMRTYPKTPTKCESVRGMKQGRAVRVEAYSGYRVNERPMAVITEGRRLVVRRIMARCRTPDGDEFAVELEDGRVCRMTWDACKDRWLLI